MEFSVKKPTKFTRLTFVLKSGNIVSGEYHVPSGTGSSVRPSDALRDVGAMISLVNAQITRANGAVSQVDFIRLAMDAVEWVEFPPITESWQKGPQQPRTQAPKAVVPEHMKR